MSQSNKLKLINDPVYGFINLPFEILYDIIEHPYFQRLRRIKQLGLSSLVYPGALHTRFHHALGAMHLMNKAIIVLKQKGKDISVEEHEAACIAILLHDIGHGPYSHTLENVILKDIHHEWISEHIFKLLNKEFSGKLTLALEMFQGIYERHFFKQLISGQLDVDRLDYLKRDSFYTGVSEGVVGSERILHMLDVVNDELVIEEKGIYSIEKFLVARRIMYWQVYLHKTTLSAEKTLIKALNEAKNILNNKGKIFLTDDLRMLFETPINKKSLQSNELLMQAFLNTDDSDIMVCIKMWARDEKNTFLSFLSKMIVNRKLPRLIIRNQPFTEADLEAVKFGLIQQCATHDLFLEKMVETGAVENDAYGSNEEPINIKMKNGNIVDIAKASDNDNIKALRGTVTKYYLYTPK